MKKMIILLMLVFSALLLAEERYIYETVPVTQKLDSIRVVRVLNGEDTGLYGIIDLDNNFLTKTNNILISLQENYIYLVDIDYKEGLMTLDGKWIAEIGKYKYKDKHSSMYMKSVGKSTREFFIVYSKDNGSYKYGYIDYNGELIIPMEYDEAQNFNEGLAGVKSNGKWGFIDENGNVRIGFNFDSVSDFKDGMALVKLGDESYYIDKQGNRKIFKSLYKNVKGKIENIGFHIGEAFEKKLRIKEKTR
ncbi:WG repeat-containing protein [Fusobacterium sp.]|uniref:WG repeat-containing protein n=1 Tax=Fusobacterium sp. TaxID=68766 RepID=UPI0025C015AF|nr:WG repeat-containing protein [Fusobacterium sp.]